MLGMTAMSAEKREAQKTESGPSMIEMLNKNRSLERTASGRNFLEAQEDHIIKGPEHLGTIEEIELDKSISRRKSTVANDEEKDAILKSLAGGSGEVADYEKEQTELREEDEQGKKKARKHKRSCCARTVRCVRVWRLKMYRMILYPERSKLGVAFFLFINFFIVLAAVALIVESLPWARARWPELWWSIDVVTSAVFTVEWVFRLLVYPSVWRYLSMYMTWVDLIAILPFYISTVMVFFNDSSADQIIGYLVVLRVLRVARTIRIVNNRRMMIWRLLLFRTLVIVRRPFMMLFLFYFMGILIYSCFLFFAERNYFDEDRRVYINWEGGVSKFQGIPDTFWIALVTLAQVGYGDEFPVGTMGKIVACAMCLSGVLVFALPISIIGETFHSEFNRLEKATSHIQAVFRGFKHRTKESKLKDNYSSVMRIILHFIVRRRRGFKLRFFECGYTDDDLFRAKVLGNEIALGGRAPASYVDLIIANESIKKEAPEVTLDMDEFFERYEEHYRPVVKCLEDAYEECGMNDLLNDIMGTFENQCLMIEAHLLGKHIKSMQKIQTEESLSAEALARRQAALRREVFIQEEMVRAREIGVVNPWTKARMASSGYESVKRVLERTDSANSFHSTGRGGDKAVRRNQVAPYAGIPADDDKYAHGSFGLKQPDAVRMAEVSAMARAARVAPDPSDTDAGSLQRSAAPLGPHLAIRPNRISPEPTSLPEAPAYEAFVAPPGLPGGGSGGGPRRRLSSNPRPDGSFKVPSSTGDHGLEPIIPGHRKSG